MRTKTPRAAWKRWMLTFWLAVVLGVFPRGAPARAQEPTGCPGPSTYRVQPGDTLSAIAERFGTDVATLVALNNLSDPDHIFVGQRLLLPCPRSPADQALVAALAGIAVGQALPNASHTPWATFWQARARVFLQLAAWPDVLSVRWAPLRPVPGATVVVRLWLQPGVSWTPEVRIGDVWFPMAPTEDGFVAFVPLHGFVKPGLLTISVRLGESPRRILELPVWVQEKAFATQYVMLPAEKSSLLDRNLVQAEWERLQAVWQRASGPPLWRGPFLWPLDATQWSTTTPYGTRRSYNGGPPSSYHAGLDVAAPEGTPVYAPADGVVLLAEPLQVRGNAVVISHGAGVTSNYWHLSAIQVQAGQHVRAGDLIGNVGTTGLSTGPHLHWEIRVYGVPVDPVPWTRGLPLWP